MANVAAVIPARAAALLLQPQQRLEGRRQLAVELVGALAGSASRPRAPAAIVGESCCRATAPGCRSRNSRSELREQRPDPRQGPDRRLLGRRALGDRLLDERPGDVGERGEGGVERAEHLRLDLGDRRDLGGGGAERVDEPGEAGLGEARLRITGSRHLEHAGQAPERRVDRRAAAGERVAELEQVLLGRRPGRLVEHAEHRVELDRLRRRGGERDRRCPPRSPCRSCPC